MHRNKHLKIISLLLTSLISISCMPQISATRSSKKKRLPPSKLKSGQTLIQHIQRKNSDLSEQTTAHQEDLSTPFSALTLDPAPMPAAQETAPDEERASAAAPPSPVPQETPNQDIVNVFYINTNAGPALVMAMRQDFAETDILDEEDIDLVTTLTIQELRKWKKALDAAERKVYILCIPKKIHKRFADKTIQETGEFRWCTLDPELMLSNLPPVQSDLLKAGYIVNGYVFLYHESYFSPCSPAAGYMVMLSQNFLEYISEKMKFFLPLTSRVITSDMILDFKPILTDPSVINGINRMTQLLLESDFDNWEKRFLTDTECQETMRKLRNVDPHSMARQTFNSICLKINEAISTHDLSIMHQEINFINLLRAILAFTAF